MGMVRTCCKLADQRWVVHATRSIGLQPLKKRCEPRALACLITTRIQSRGHCSPRIGDYLLVGGGQACALILEDEINLRFAMASHTRATRITSMFTRRRSEFLNGFSLLMTSETSVGEVGVRCRDGGVGERTCDYIGLR